MTNRDEPEMEKHLRTLLAELTAGVGDSEPDPEAIVRSGRWSRRRRGVAVTLGLAAGAVGMALGLNTVLGTHTSGRTQPVPYTYSPGAVPVGPTANGGPSLPPGHNQPRLPPPFDPAATEPVTGVGATVDGPP